MQLIVQHVKDQLKKVCTCDYVRLHGLTYATLTHYREDLTSG